MPLILDRNAVLDVHAKAAQNQWVIPTFCTENLTTTEAILSATLQYSKQINQPDIPITIAITNQYNHRSQSVNYTHTRQWDIGLKLFMVDLDVLTGKGSPYEKLKVMIHLDHVQWDKDESLLRWDMSRFSSIMYDASKLPFEENIKKTAEFVDKNGGKIVVEGACDEIVDATGVETSQLTTPKSALYYLNQTQADFIVANLGTEHRANAADLIYQSDLAKQISKLTGPRLVLHGTSSVGLNQLKNLFDDGVAKVNIWTCLERDSSPSLFMDMVKNASKINGVEKVDQMIKAGLLGHNVAKTGKLSLSYYTTTYRQNIVFKKMEEIVQEYLHLWYI